jgi:hypothetical protein
MSDFNTIGADLFATHTIPQFKVGTKITRGGTGFIYLKNGSSSITASYAYTFNPTSTDLVVTAALRGSTVGTAARGVVVYQPRTTALEGVATVPANEYFWGATEGDLRIYAGANCATNVPIYSSTGAGVLDDDSASQVLVKGLFLKTTITTSVVANFYSFLPMTVNT